ncbi:MAG: DUF1592 domain-containing protein, partial [Myxococcales bacterium]|nr:DUF1592 domain-containing protein [Myxococcales bacterium]
SACADPGRVTLRRLNRVEYDNSIRDLLGDESRPAQEFPDDDIGYGFDNIGDVLSVSPLHVEKYEAAAEAVVERALRTAAVRTERVFEAEDVGADVGASWQGEYWVINAEGAMTLAFGVPIDAEYLIRVRAFGQQAGDEPVHMALVLDGEEVLAADVEATEEAPEWYEVRAVLAGGPHTLDVAFLNDFFDPENPDRTRRDRNLVLDAIVVDGPIGGGIVRPIEQTFECEDVGADIGGARGDFWNLWSNGELVVDLNLPGAGEYEIRVRAAGQQAGPDPARMALSFDREVLARYDVVATAAAPEWYTHRLVAAAGGHSVGVSFLNDYYMPEDPDPAQRDRNLLLDAIVVEGPFGGVAPEEAPEAPMERSPLLVCDLAGPDDYGCAGQIVTAFARRAWRRPIEPEETDRLLGLVRLAREQGDPLVEGLKLALRAVLLSPHFLYKVELDADPTSLTPHRLTDHELAVRLSYFVWGTTPDAELDALADAGRLGEPEVLAEQVGRMLADARAEGLVDNFGGQWLYTRAMADVAPDYNYFPAFDDLLRASMSIETLAVFRRFVRENLPLRGLIDFDETYLNQRLAEHYGIDFEAGVEDDEAPAGFRRFSLDGTGRRGVLTLGSTLTVTSLPTRTSPVKRGKWVLEQLMCDEPPPPPPGVEAVLGEVDQAATLRERLAQHRANPDCALCHDRMDPIGLGLENFDAIGAFRMEDNGIAIDASGSLPGGVDFVGATALADILREDARFTRCFHEKLFTFALGRGPERADRACLAELAETADANDWRLQDVIEQLVQSPAFTARRGEPEEEE